MMIGSYSGDGVLLHRDTTMGQAHNPCFPTSISFHTLLYQHLCLICICLEFLGWEVADPLSINRISLGSIYKTPYMSYLVCLRFLQLVMETESLHFYVSRHSHPIFTLPYQTRPTKDKIRSSRRWWKIECLVVLWIVIRGVLHFVHMS